MVISCLGDSLTEGDYGVLGKTGIANIHKENYPYFLSKSTGAQVRNFGRCGANPTSYWEYCKQGNVNVIGSDVIIIMLGTNGGPEYGLDPDRETQGNIDYNKIVEMCKKDAPNAKLILCTSPHASENPKYLNCRSMPTVRKSAKFVRRYASENHISLIDVLNCKEISAETEDIMQPNDGLHFGMEGYRTLAMIIEREMKKIIR